MYCFCFAFPIMSQSLLMGGKALRITVTACDSIQMRTLSSVCSPHPSACWWHEHKSFRKEALTDGWEEKQRFCSPSSDVRSWCPQRPHNNRCRHRKSQKSCGRDSRWRVCGPSPAENRRAAGWYPGHRTSRQWAPAERRGKQNKTKKLTGEVQMNYTRKTKPATEWANWIRGMWRWETFNMKYRHPLWGKAADAVKQEEVVEIFSYITVIFQFVWAKNKRVTEICVWKEARSGWGGCSCAFVRETNICSCCFVCF